MKDETSESQAPSQPAEKAPLLVRIPPPLQFGAIYILGLVIHSWFPISIVPVGLKPGAHVVGMFLIAAGIIIAVASFLLFVHRRTTVIPHGAPARLIDVGPFLFSRNPMYLSLTMIYTGAAFWQVAIWPLILLPIPIAIVNGVVIPFEERRLHSIFGNSYDEYRRRVRRWI